jgi:hypothetical protein
VHVCVCQQEPKLGHGLGLCAHDAAHRQQSSRWGVTKTSATACVQVADMCCSLRCCGAPLRLFVCRPLMEQRIEQASEELHERIAA